MLDIKTILLVLNSIALIILTIYLVLLIVNSVDVKGIRKTAKTSYKLLNETYYDRKFARDAKRHTKSISIEMSFADKIEMYFIDKSNIRKYIPFMSFYVLMFISGIIFITTFVFVYKIIYFVPSAAIISLMFSSIPFIILELMGKRNSELARQKLANFISVLLRWSTVKEDLFYAFEKSVESNIGEPLTTYITDMVIQVKKGMDPIQALEILQIKIDNEMFKDFILNIKQCLKNQGDIINLLHNMEKQFYDIEKEYNRRKISTYRDRVTTIIIMFVVLFIGYWFLKTPQIYQFYLGTLQGKLLLMLFAILYVAGFIQFSKVTKFKL